MRKTQLCSFAERQTDRQKDKQTEVEICQFTGMNDATLD